MNQQYLLKSAFLCLIINGMLCALFRSGLDWFGSRFLFFTIFTACCLWLVLYERKIDFFKAKNFFLVFFICYILFLPASILLGNDTFYFYKYSVSTNLLALSLLLCLSAILGFGAGYKFSKNINLEFKLARRLFSDSKFQLRFKFAIFMILFLLAVGILSNIVWDYFIGWENLAEKLIYTEWVRANYFKPAYSLVFVAFMPLSIFLSFLLALKRKSLCLRILFLTYLAVYIGRLLYIGDRSEILVILLSLTCYWHYRVRNINILTILIMGLMGFIFFQILGIIRDWQVIDFDLMLEMISISSFNLFYISEFGFPYITLLKLLEDPAAFGLKYGGTYLLSIVLFIPRALFANKPYPASVEFLKVYYPGIYEAGGGLGLFVVAEAFANFSYFGPFLVLFVIGFFMAKIDVLLSKFKDHDFFIAFYSFNLPHLIWLIRQDFGAFFVTRAFWYLTTSYLVLRLVYRKNRGYNGKK